MQLTQREEYNIHIDRVEDKNIAHTREQDTEHKISIGKRRHQHHIRYFQCECIIFRQTLLTSLSAVRPQRPQMGDE